MPAYFVDVSAGRDSSEDRKEMDMRPSKLRATLPLAAGEVWRITQGWEDPGSSHNGTTASFCFDFVRVDGQTLGSTVPAAAAGRVIAVDEDELEIYCSGRGDSRRVPNR